MKKYCIYFYFFLLGFSKLSAQDSISAPKSFFNVGFLYTLSTNGELTDSTTNNISLGLLFNRSKNVYGFSLAPVNLINSSMKGVQVGFFNGTQDLRGVQIGVSNAAKNAKGLQIGFMNGVEKISGMQIGFGNFRGLQSTGLQIGLLNDAEHNNFPIGIINIIKDGEMGVALTMDDMGSTIASFRSGGKYTYGIVGLGYNFDSPNHQMVVEVGLGLKIPVFKKLSLNTELVSDFLVKPGKIEVQWGTPDEYEDEEEEYHDYKTASRTTIRLMPTYKISRKIEFFGGPSINYLLTHSMDNKALYPSHHMWQKFDSSSLKQIYWGWTFGVQYRFK